MIDPAGNQTAINHLEAAERSRAANIADEQAAFVTAAGADAIASPEDGDGIPQTGEEDPLAEVSVRDPLDGAAGFAQPERAATKQDADRDDNSDSIEPGHIPGTAEDIEVAGVTGPGPSG
jgi:hypothetical protein